MCNTVFSVKNWGHSPGADTFSVRNAETEVFVRILLVTEKAVLSLKRTTQTNPKENNSWNQNKKKKKMIWQNSCFWHISGLDLATKILSPFLESSFYDLYQCNIKLIRIVLTKKLHFFRKFQLLLGQQQKPELWSKGWLNCYNNQLISGYC